MRKKGFTILELLVVVAILAILAVIVVPNFIGAVDKSKNASELAELNSVQKAVDMYYVDNSSYPVMQANQPVYGNLENVDFGKLYHNYLGKLPHFSYWMLDYQGKVYHEGEKPATIDSNIITLKKNDYTYKVYDLAGNLVQGYASDTVDLTQYSYIVPISKTTGVELPALNSNFTGLVEHPEAPKQDSQAPTLPNDIIVSEDFSSGITDIWSTYAKGGSISVVDGELSIAGYGGTTYNGALLTLKNPIEKTGVITVEFDITPGSQYANVLGDYIEFYNSTATERNSDYAYINGYAIMANVNTDGTQHTLTLQKPTGMTSTFIASNAYCGILQGQDITYHLKYVLDCNKKSITIYRDETNILDTTLTTDNWDYIGNSIKIDIGKGNYGGSTATKIDNIQIRQDK